MRFVFLIVGIVFIVLSAFRWIAPATFSAFELGVALCFCSMIPFEGPYPWNRTP
jgi:hypothetical protein